MAIVLPTQDEFAGFRSLGLGAIQGFGKVNQRKKLLQGLTPEQQQAGQNMPLSQLASAVLGLQNDAFMSQKDKSLNLINSIITNKKLQAVQPLIDTPINDLTGQQRANMSFFGVGPQPRQAPAVAASNIGLTQDEIRQKNLLPLKDRTKRGKGFTNHTFDTDFTEDSGPNKGRRVRDTTTVPVKTEMLPEASLITRNHGSLDPGEIFSGAVDAAAENAGLISFSDAGDLIIGSDDIPVSASDITSALPDMAMAAFVTGRNPVEALEDGFLSWDSLSFEDKGGTFSDLNLSDTVLLSQVSPKPNVEQQNQLILDAVFPLLDDQTKEDIQNQAQTQNLSDAEIIELVKNSFPKGRSRRR